VFRSRLRILAPPLAIALLALAGCGGLTINQASTSQNGLEKTTLNVAVVPAEATIRALAQAIVKYFTV